MHIGVELLFDDISGDALRSLEAAVRAEFASSVEAEGSPPPHVRLTSLSEEPSFLRHELDRLGCVFAPFEVVLDGVGWFPQGIVYLTPRDPEPFRAIHAELHRVLVAEGVRGNPHYEPNVWRPHCTVGFGLPAEVLADAVEWCRLRMPTVRVRVDSVGVIGYRPAHELYRVGLASGAAQ